MTKKIFVLSVLFFVFINTGYCIMTVNLATDPFPPYINVDENKICTGGIYVEIVKKIFSQIKDTELVLKTLPWPRCLKAAEYGDVDGILMLFKTPKRQKFLHYSEPILKEEMLLWFSIAKYPKGIPWNSMSNLIKYHYVIKQDYSITPEFDAAYKNKALNVTIVRNHKIALKMVFNDRVDLVPINKGQGYNLVANNDYSGKIIPASKPLGSVSYYLAMSKKSSALKLIPKINEIVAQLNKDGFIENALKGKTLKEKVLKENTVKKK